MELPPFEPFAKIPRLRRWCFITEKLDGTNGQVHVLEDGTVLAGSRSRYITPEADNHGFAAWVRDHADELREMGPGRHYGEWWGSGIQRRYGLQEKRFSLFNTGRWGDDSEHEGPKRPKCCHVVPVLHVGMFSTDAVETAIEELRQRGSAAAPGFMQPEGVMVYHIAANMYFKRTLLKDEEHKGKGG